MAGAKAEGATPTGTKNVHEKLLAIQAQSENVKKAGWHDFNKFAYMQEHHVFELLKPHLDAQRATVTVSCADEVHVVEAKVGNKEKPGHLTTLVGTVTFTDVDTGEQITERYVGQALDNEGKGAGKAQTYLVKYALQKFFLIPTEAIEDTDHAEGGARGTEATQAAGAAPAQAAAPAPEAAPVQDPAPAASADGKAGPERANALLEKLTPMVKEGRVDGNKVKAKLATFRVAVSPDGLASLSTQDFDTFRDWLNKELAKGQAAAPAG